MLTDPIRRQIPINSSAANSGQTLLETSTDTEEYVYKLFVVAPSVESGPKGSSASDSPGFLAN